MYISVFSRYGSIETSSLHSNVTVIPKRPPPLTEDHTLAASLTLDRSSSLNEIQDRCYEISNTDLVRIPQTI